MGMEGPPGRQHQPVASALFVGQLHLVTGREQPAALDDHDAQASAGAGQPARYDPSYSGERQIEVGGREYPEHLAGRLDQQVLAGRRLLNGLDQVHA